MARERRKEEAHPVGCYVIAPKAGEGKGAQAPLNGNATHPVIRFIKEHLPGGDPETGTQGANFNLTRPWTKFLVDHRGLPVRLYCGIYSCGTGHPDAELEAGILEQLRVKDEYELGTGPRMLQYKRGNGVGGGREGTEPKGPERLQGQKEG